MNKGHIRHLFPGGNTPNGFHSFYDYIIPEPTRIIILKGGPGVGKSTFMRKIAAAFCEQGYLIEHHHCSSDNKSLDGVVIPDLGIAVIDGTAPHIVDPKHPGCIDEIIHLGDFWNEDELCTSKDIVVTINAEIKECFQRAYRLLGAAKSIYNDWEAANIRAMDYSKANSMTAAVLNTVFPEKNTIVKTGKIRKLFASAITPDGSVHYLESLIAPNPKKIVLTGDPGTGRSTLLKKVVDTALLVGLDVEAFYCPLDPEKIEHVIIPEMNLAITTAFEPHKYIPADSMLSINMNDCLKSSSIKEVEDMVTYDKRMFKTLFTQAVSHIHKVKQLHDELEKCYIPAMNFNKIDQVWQQTYTKLLKYSNHK